MNFTDSVHCQSRAHCRACLNDAAWRAKVGAPDVCPYGVTDPVAARASYVPPTPRFVPPQPKLKTKGKIKMKFKPKKKKRLLGDIMAKILRPIAKLFKMKCYDDKTGELKPTSPCAKRRDWINKKNAEFNANMEALAAQGLAKFENGKWWVKKKRMKDEFSKPQ